MKKHSFFVLLLISLYSGIIAKDINVKKIPNGFELSIKFNQHVYNINNNSKLDFIYNEDESNSGKPKLPSKTFFIAIPPKSKARIELTEKNITQIRDVDIALNRMPANHNDSVHYKTYENHNNSIKSDIYPEEDYEIMNYTWVRGFYCAVVKINTHRYSFKDRTLNIIESCSLRLIYDSNNVNYIRNGESSLFDETLKELIINYEEAKEFRTNYKFTFADTSDNWIDYSKDYIKISVANDNIYRITYDYFVKHDINPDLINPATIKIFWKGKEIPIYVKGEEDNKFNESDYIEFYCEKNYSGKDYRKVVNKGEDYVHYMNLYDDTTNLWITWGGEKGKRIEINKSNYSQIGDTVDYHLVKLHLEKDERLWYYDPTEPRVQLPFWQENKLYTWLIIGNSGSLNVDFNASNCVENSIVKIFTRLISYSADVANNPEGIYNTHKIGISLNSSSIQKTIVYNYKETINFISTFDSGQLKNGINTIRIFGLPTSVSFHQSLIDWIDVEYFRKNIAVDDSISITIPDTLRKKLRVIKIENIAGDKSNLLVYKIFPSFKKIDNYLLLGEVRKSLQIIDTVTGGDKYFITKIEKVGEPIFRYKKHFVNLRDKSRQADYIIITNKSLSNSAVNYKKFINNSYSIKTELVYDEDIYDEFSYGQVDAQAIKSFLINAYENWCSPKPSYLAIIGDANYDYKNITSFAPIMRKKNLVISYGFPVSDIWYVIWDSTITAVPQMYVGRIPASNDEQVIFYMNKHQKYISRKYDRFNKTFLFFSGGNTTRQSELQEIKNVNDALYQNYVLSSPYFGTGTHFYKTISPQTNFGPYSNEEFQKIIDDGGLFISYIGHSGTRTWDNGITEVEHLKNKFSDRFPLITDFGCSTGKFAEPDVDAFGELFICQSSDGQAIAYLGNSSWGYLSTSLRFPKYFYEIFLKDSSKGIGHAHLLAKIRQLTETGFNDINRVFTYCNLLLGDPIVNLALPSKPNLYVDNSKINLLSSNLNDKNDSALIKINVSNYGLYKNVATQIKIEDVLNDKILFKQLININLPKYEDTLLMNIPIKNYAGKHKIRIELDITNSIDEIYEDDNYAEFEFFVYSTSFAPLISSKHYSIINDTLLILNPIEKLNNDIDEIIIQFDESSDFLKPIEIVKPIGMLITKIPLNQLEDNKRYYFRLRLNDKLSPFSDVYSFKKINNKAEILIDEPVYNDREFVYSNTIYDNQSKSWKLNSRSISLIVKSAGWLDGSYGSILYDNNEQLPSTFYWGIAAAIIDSITLKPKTVKYFLVPDTGAADSLVNFINSLAAGTMVAMTICADAQQNIIGGKNSKARNAIKSLGSFYIDSVQYRDSWCIIGKKGATPGSVPEAYKKQLRGPVQIEISKNLMFDNGFLIFPELTSSSKWEKIIIDSYKPDNSKIVLTPVGINIHGEYDTLKNFISYTDSVDISQLDASKYPGIKLIAKFFANEKKESPIIKSFWVYFSSLPELVTNYQTTWIECESNPSSKDSIKQGERINFHSKIFNAGKSNTGKFDISLQLVKPDNSIINLKDTLIDNLTPFEYTSFSYQYINNDGYGNFNFILTIDKKDEVKELIENNNTFVKTFYVQKDTITSISASSIVVKFNEIEINDWDYVDPETDIKIEIYYPSMFMQEDTTAFKLLLDNKVISYFELKNAGVIDYDTMNRKVIILFHKNFEEGEHSLKIFTKDAAKKFNTLLIYEKYFIVTSEIEIKNVYNFPNPFSGYTYFTFVLTQIPDEVKIKIYTVAGRLIKQINVYNYELTTNLNKVYWDGRDDDGNIVSNGIYFYKIIVKKKDKTESAIQKLAILK